MTQLHFTVNSEEIQTIISESEANQTAKTLLTIFFNQLMEQQRNEHKNESLKEMVITNEIIPLE